MDGQQGHTHALNFSSKDPGIKSLTCPSAIKHYDAYLYVGGVDIMDQKKVMHQFDRKSKMKYYMKLAFDLIDIALNNSHIIYMMLSESYPI